MPNVFKNDEQRKHWNAYNTAYSRRTYRTITAKFNKVKDADVIAWIDSQGKTFTEAVRGLVREKIG